MGERRKRGMKERVKREYCISRGGPDWPEGKTD